MHLNSDLGAKVAGFTSGSYTKVTGLAYDSTNKKLGLKVNGADTVIPFSSGTASYVVFDHNGSDSGSIMSYCNTDGTPVTQQRTSGDASQANLCASLKQSELLSNAIYNASTQSVVVTIAKTGTYMSFNTSTGLNILSKVTYTAGQTISVRYSSLFVLIPWIS